MRPPSDFNDEFGFPVVGGRCALATCNAHDFLPHVCRWCGLAFCQDHSEVGAHDCNKASKQIGSQASFCPLCQETVLWDVACSSEAVALDTHRLCCKGKPQAKDRCPVAGCGAVVGVVNAVVCSSCGVRVCMAHRFEDAHSCVPKFAPVSGKAPRAASAAPIDSSVLAVPPSTPPYNLTAASPEASAVETIRAARAAEKLADANVVASPQELRALRQALGGTTASRDSCLAALRRKLSDIKRRPLSPAVRLVSPSDLSSREMFVPSGAVALLRGVGFESQDGGALELPQGVGQGRIDVVLRILA